MLLEKMCDTLNGAEFLWLWLSHEELLGLLEGKSESVLAEDAISEICEESFKG